MNTISPGPTVAGELFVDAREAAYTMNLPMYYLTHAKQRMRLAIPYYRIGRSVPFKLSELADSQRVEGGIAPEQTAEGEVLDA